MTATALIYVHLAQNLAFVEAVADYKGTPALFSDAAPDDYQQAADPCAVIRAPSVDRPDDTYGENGRYVEQRVHFYATRTGSSVAIDAAAEIARNLFHDQAKALGVVLVTVLGPVDTPTTDPAVIGRQITIRINKET